MDLITPGIGLIFWTTIVFLLLMTLLGKFAWKPILKAVHLREANINDSLKAAEQARIELASLEQDKEMIVRDAKSEKLRLIDEGKATQVEIIREAKVKAKQEAEKIVESAKKDFEAEKQKAVESLKQQLAVISIDMASKILESEIDTTKKHEEIINKMLDKANFN
ncbi:F0F1 ATP synthase subunit B [Saccharicrinis sp. FJH54]|uniref:F0F1 ATP synthase subunit B n=1 Tax=Saccharicrinis sp. FJH54 TaxID=3344665 RepID=UPI0035D407BB